MSDDKNTFIEGLIEHELSRFRTRLNNAEREWGLVDPSIRARKTHKYNSLVCKAKGQLLNSKKIDCKLNSFLSWKGYCNLYTSMVEQMIGREKWDKLGGIREINNIREIIAHRMPDEAWGKTEMALNRLEGMLK